MVKLYDPDRYIIEVGENMKMVCRHFLNTSMTLDEIATRMNVPQEYVDACI